MASPHTNTRHEVNRDLKMYRFNDVGCFECDVLYTCSSIVLDIFFNLTDPLAWSRLIDWHFDGPLPVSDHHRAEAAIICVDLATEKRKRQEKV